jgi:hypothetical protein
MVSTVVDIMVVVAADEAAIVDIVVDIIIVVKYRK